MLYNPYMLCHTATNSYVRYIQLCKMLPLEETGYTQDLSVLFLTTAWESTSTSKQKIIIKILLQKAYTLNIEDPKNFQ